MASVDWISAAWVLWEVLSIVWIAAVEKRVVTTPDWITAGVGIVFAFTIMAVELRARNASDRALGDERLGRAREVADERLARAKEAADLKADIARLTGYQEGAFPNLARGLRGIEDKITDPQSKAAVSELRQEVEQLQKPAIGYDSFDDRIFVWRNGDKPHYVHAWFRNEPTGVAARDAAAKLSWWDAEDTSGKPLFTCDGKWQNALREKPIDILPNNASHPLDLFVYKPEEGWHYALSSLIQPVDERYRLHLEIYKVKVTISCEGYSKDFFFQVVIKPTICVREFGSADGTGSELRDAIQR
jgi:hypothetical protein